VATLTVDDTVARGHVSFPHGFEPPVGSLISSTEDVDPLTGMVRQSGVPVRIEPEGPDTRSRGG
jgi:hypothetical protein